MTDPVRRRRHGKQLEAELLAAAWEELIATGYGRLTMESIASRARTSEAVLYRRWPNKDQLVMAAIDSYRDANPVPPPPDTGSLRTDLIAHLTAVAEARAGLFAIAAATAFTGLMADTGMTPGQVRDRLMPGQTDIRTRAVYLRAHERGEIDLDAVPAAVLAMPFDLARHDLLLNLTPPPPERITSIVDELFLPLLERCR